MPLTTAQIIRNRINDPMRYDTEVVQGDGVASSFKLKQGAPFSTISASSFTASTAAGGTAWSATGCAIDIDLGVVTFSAVVPINAQIQASYVWSCFSEDMLGYFTGMGGIPQACLGAVNHLLVNYATRARWAAPDGSNHDDTMALNALLATRSALIDEIRGSELGPMGDSVSWAESQQDFF